MFLLYNPEKSSGDRPAVSLFCGFFYLFCHVQVYDECEISFTNITEKRMNGFL